MLPLMTRTEIDSHLMTMEAGTILMIDRLITERVGNVDIAERAFVEISQVNAVRAARQLRDWPNSLAMYKQWDEFDAQDWAASCRAMEKAEGDHYDGYDVEAQADLNAPTLAEQMGWDTQNI